MHIHAIYIDALLTVILLLYEVILESMSVVRKTKNGLCTLYNGGYLVARQCMINMSKDDGGMILRKRACPTCGQPLRNRNVFYLLSTFILYTRSSPRD